MRWRRKAREGGGCGGAGEEGGVAEEAGEMSVWECVCAGCKGAAAEAAAVAVAVAVGGRVNEVEKGRRAKAASGEVLGKRKVRRMRRGRWVCCVCAGCVEGRGV